MIENFKYIKAFAEDKKVSYMGAIIENYGRTTFGYEFECYKIEEKI